MAAQAARDPTRVLTTLAHLIDGDCLREAYHRTRTASAPGSDGVTAQEYAAHRDAPLHALHERRRSGGSQAPPVERVGLDKAAGGPRPLGQPTWEDQRVQRAVAMRWEAI